jgi:valacyclovir hydrolase
MPHFTYKNHRLFYREQGNGPLLLVLPGNTASSACHEGELAHFGQRYHTVSLDFLGTGQSDRMAIWPDDWWKQDAYQAKALVEHLGQTRCLAMGTSGGAVVALLMAILFPNQMQAVVADSCVERFTPEMLQKNVAERAQRTPGQIAFWQHAHGDDWSQVVEADSDLLLRFAESGGNWFKGRLQEIKCPVLFTASKQDDALPNVTQQICRMAEQVANSRIFLNNEGDHPLMWSRPDDFRHVSDYFVENI